MSNRIISKYLKNSLKHCPLVFRKKLKEDLYDSLLEYLAENPEADEDELAVCFGTPEQYTAEYIASLDGDEQVKYLSKSHFVKRIVAVGIAAVILLVAVGVGAVLYDVHYSSNYYYEITVEQE